MEASLFLAKSAFPAAGRDARPHFAVAGRCPRVSMLPLVVGALENGAGAPGNTAKKSGARGVRNSNYVVPLDLTPSFCRPLKEILRDLNKTVPGNIINRNDNSIPWHTVSQSTGSVSLNDGRFKDPVAAAEELAFCKASARFGFVLYLHHEDETL